MKYLTRGLEDAPEITLAAMPWPGDTKADAEKSFKDFMALFAPFTDRPGFAVCASYADGAYDGSGNFVKSQYEPLLTFAVRLNCDGGGNSLNRFLRLRIPEFLGGERPRPPKVSSKNLSALAKWSRSCIQFRHDGIGFRCVFMHDGEIAFKENRADCRDFGKKPFLEIIRENFAAAEIRRTALG